MPVFADNAVTISPFCNALAGRAAAAVASVCCPVMGLAGSGPRTVPMALFPAGNGCAGSSPTVTIEVSGAELVIVVIVSEPALITPANRARNCGKPATGT